MIFFGTHHRGKPRVPRNEPFDSSVWGANRLVRGLLGEHVGSPLQPWVNFFALKRKHREYAFMHFTQRLFLDEAIQRLHTQGELAQG